MGIDNQDTPIHEMTDADLESAMADFEEEIQPEEELESDTPDDELEPDTIEWTPPESLRFGDEELPYSEVQELVSKGKDYTKKSQALAEERKEVEAWIGLRDRWNQGPAEQAELVKQLAALAGVQVPAQDTQSNTELDNYGNQVDWEDMTDNERHLYAMARRQEAAFEAKFAKLDPLLKELHGVIGRQHEAEQRDTKATEAQAVLRSDLGVEVTAESIRNAMETTGLDDPVAAWLKANMKDFAKAQAAKGASAVKAKPNTPGQTGGRTFDPDKKNADGQYVYSPSRVAELIERGYSPLAR